MQKVNKQRIRKSITIIGYLANSLLLLITILSAYGGMVNPEKSTIPAMLAMTFPVWLFATIAALVISFLFDKRMAIIPGATLLICIGPILDFCPLHCFGKKLSDEEKTHSFTILSYNAFGLVDYTCESKNDMKKILRNERDNGINNPTLQHILDYNADILCLQEFEADKTFKRSVISAELYDRTCATYPYRLRAKDNVILSKYPIEPITLTYPGRRRNPPYMGAIANIQGHRTLIICLHIASVGLNNDDKALYREITNGEGGKTAIKTARHQLLSKLSKAFRNRSRMTSFLRERIDSLGIDNVIIAGDFNDINNCYAIRQLQQDDFKEAFIEAGCGPTITYHANRFYFQIDHILYRGDMEAVDYKRDKFKRSDHYPILTTFLWKE